MKYTLKSFSQDIHLSSPEESQHFLVFERGDGTDFRIPVPQETIIALTKSTLAYEAKLKPSEDTDEETTRILEEVEEELRAEAEEGTEAFFEEDDATVFPDGNDLEDVEPPAPVAKVKKAQFRQPPVESEEDVPSL